MMISQLSVRMTSTSNDWVRLEAAHRPIECQYLTAECFEGYFLVESSKYLYHYQVGV